MDENDVRRMFTESEPTVRAAPVATDIRRAARRRLLRDIGLPAVGVAAAAAIGVAAIAVPNASDPDPAATRRPTHELDCNGRAIASTILDNFSGKGYATPRRAIMQSMHIPDGSELLIVDRPGHYATGVIGRPDGTVNAKVQVGRAAGGGDGWQVTSAASCAGFGLRPARR